jgi:hypothetical protein
VTGCTGVRAPDRLHARLGKPEVLDLAFLDQLPDRAGDVFDRHVRVDAVLVEQIDRVDLEPLERALDGLFDVLRPAVEPPLLPLRVELEAELGRDHNLFAHWRKSFANEFFVRERSVDLGRVEEADAALDGRADERNHLLLVTRWAVGEAHAHAAEADGRDFQVAVSKRSLLHCVSFQNSIRTLIASRSFIAR